MMTETEAMIATINTLGFLDERQDVALPSIVFGLVVTFMQNGDDDLIVENTVRNAPPEAVVKIALTALGLLSGMCGLQAIVEGVSPIEWATTARDDLLEQALTA